MNNTLDLFLLIMRLQKRKSFYLSKTELDILDKNGLIVNIDKGGFIKGRFHSEGGVKVLFRQGRNFKIFAEVEGCEFVMNHFSTIEGQIILEELNEKYRSMIESFTPYDTPKNVNIIDATDIKIGEQFFPKFLLASKPFTVINKPATKEHYILLNEQNIVSEHLIN